MRKLFSILSLSLLYVIITYGQAAVNIPLTVRDGIRSNNLLAVGVDSTATVGLDIGLGEAELPPFPPPGDLEVRFDLSPYAGLPLSTYKDYRYAAYPYSGVNEHKLIWQLTSGATIFDIDYNLPPEATMVIKDVAGGILFNSGTLSDSGTYSIPPSFIGLNAAIITVTVTVIPPCPVFQASSPNPLDVQTDVQITDISLQWVNGGGTETVEVWFGPDGRALKLYDGAPITSWPLGTLDYGTEYTWFIVSKSSVCGTEGPNWLFTTVHDTNLVIDTVIVYPQNLSNWTGTCNSSSKTQISLVNGYDTELGWMVFDLTAIPNNVNINSVEFNGFLYENSWPYWSITPMGNVNPITDPASAIFNQVSTHSGQGIAYSYNEEAATLSNSWVSRTLGSTVTLDFQSALTKNWFAIGILDFDFSTSYYVKFQGWAEANKPYLRVIYSFHGVTTFQYSADVDNNWNLISIPGLLPDNQNIDNWFPFRDQSANVFSYVSGLGYSLETLLTPGTGYWMKHTGDRTYNTGDEWPTAGVNLVIHDPIDVSTGWNIFGVYEEQVPTAGLTTIPSGLLGGPVYGYSGGYYIANQLIPGSGYWVKSSNNGQIIIPDIEGKINNEVTDWIKADWGKIHFTDAAGINYTLYAVNGNPDLSLYELPAVPPAGMFDIRFGSGRIAEDINSSVQSIELSGVTYPITVRAEGMDIKLTDETGNIINVNLKDGEDVVISDAAIMKLMVSGELIPAVYALEQNYPNPFNPSTMIEFSLPEDVSSVKLSIYNALGEKVAELVNSSLSAGKYSYQWNAQNVATGMYIYELRTDKFVSVKKMLLLK